MFNHENVKEWVENVSDLSTTDPLLGGADGHLTQAAKALVKRTSYLKEKVEDLTETLGEGLAVIDGGTY